MEGQIASPGFTTAAQPAMSILFEHLARSIADGSPAADSMFDELVELSAARLANHHRGQSRDPRAYAALLVAMELGALVVREQSFRALGADIFEPEGHARLTRAKVDFHSQRLLGAELAAHAHAALDQLREPGRAISARNRSRRDQAEP